MKLGVGHGAMEPAALVDERNGPLAHKGLENALRFPQLPQPAAEGSHNVQSEQATPKRSPFLVRRMGSTSSGPA